MTWRYYSLETPKHH